VAECEHCAAGHTPTKRSETGEWVHNRSWALDQNRPGAGRMFSHTLCTRLTPVVAKMPRLRVERRRA